MIALILCVLAFLLCYLFGRRSLGWGLVALLTFGYFYGILRANLLMTFSHFIFDAGMIGLYCSQKWGSAGQENNSKQASVLRWWVLLLVVWPVLLVFLPFQPLLVALVGLRGHIFFLPVLILGSKLREKELFQLGLGISALNLVALCFAGAEYYMGIQRFFPVSPVTQIIYSSGDVAGGYFRIPAIFTSAHAYGGTMIGTLPYLLGLWARARVNWQRIWAIGGVSAAFLGVLLSATRLNFVLALVIIAASLVTNRMSNRSRLVFVLLIAALGVAALRNERFQRFKSLSDTEAVSERLAGSVNKSFLEILFEYPMGNGLGGGGTSIPYFLQGQVRNPIGMENQYAMILSEQGIIGLLLWLGFAGWYFTRIQVAFAKGPWATGRRVVWCLAAFGLATSWFGVGMLTAIPSTVISILGMGWTAVRMEDPQLQAPLVRGTQALRYRHTLVPSGSRAGHWA